MNDPRVLVVGAGGRLGAPMFGVFTAAGFDVVGADVDPDAVAALAAGVPPARVNEPGLPELLASIDGPEVTTDVAGAAAQSDVVFVVVPTPSGSDDRFDASMVHGAVTDIARGFVSRAGSMPDGWHPVIVVVSTVMPGECEKIIAGVHAVTGWHDGDEYSLCYSPAFIALGSVIDDLRNPDVVYVGCADDLGASVVAAISRRVAPLAMRQRLSLIDAEIAKLSLNVALSVKIGFANTVARVCEQFAGADASHVLDAVGADSRIGPKYLRHGGTPSGPCFGRDRRAYETLVDGSGCSLVRAADDAARDVVEWVVRAVEDACMGKRGERARVGVLGLGYKPGSSITDEALGWEVAERLAASGFSVYTHDPYVSGLPAGCHTVGLLETLELPVVVVAMDHPEYEGVAACSGQTCIDIWGCCREGAGRLIRPGIGLALVDGLG